MGSGCSGQMGTADVNQHGGERHKDGDSNVVLELVTDFEAADRPWNIVETVPRASRIDDDDHGKMGSPVFADAARVGLQVYVILDGHWWAGEVTCVSRSNDDDKLEVRLFGAKKNTPGVLVNLTTAQFRVRRAPSSFFTVGARLEVLDQFVSRKTKRYKEKWRQAKVVAYDGTSTAVKKVEISFEGWGQQHNIWLDVVADASRLRPHIDHSPRDWAMSYFRGGRVGLNNMGNTCYMNVAIQCLAHIRPLALYFLTGEYKRDLNKERSTTKGRIALAFAQVVTMLWYGCDSHSCNPSSLKKAMGHLNREFAGYKQHDAQEFLCFLLDALHEDLNRIDEPTPYEELDKRETESTDEFSERCWRYDKARSNSYIKDLFCGQLHSTITCRECGAVSTCFDPFWNLSVPITKMKHVTIESCIAKFSKTEELKDDDMYYCGNCKAHRVCSKTIRVWRSPRVLVLHLRRFAQRGTRFHKTNAEIDFPLKGLNMAPFWRNGAADHDASAAGSASNGDAASRQHMLYNLNSFASHIGVANDGHYVATCQCLGADDSKTQQWMLYNDEQVDGLTRINKRKAYILFYMRAESEDEYTVPSSTNNDAPTDANAAPAHTLMRTSTPNTEARFSGPAIGSNSVLV